MRCTGPAVLLHRNVPQAETWVTRRDFASHVVRCPQRRQDLARPHPHSLMKTKEKTGADLERSHIPRPPSTEYACACAAENFPPVKCLIFETNENRRPPTRGAVDQLCRLLLLHNKNTTAVYCPTATLDIPSLTNTTTVPGRFAQPLRKRALISSCFVLPTSTLVVPLPRASAGAYVRPLTSESLSIYTHGRDITLCRTSSFQNSKGQ